MSSLPRIIATAFLALMFGLVSTGGAQAATPKYGPWTDPVYGLQGRISPASAKQAKTYVQVRRISADTTENIGDRQVRVSYKIGSGKTRTSSIRTLAKGELTTFVTAKAACGARVTITISGRGRASSSQAWSDWQDLTSSFTRSC
ncbi:hypothetical protein GCM10022215_16070 [Nocardioides fonticola]|uniref:Uncharacterized protein n=1 Tax=Nocardioides fonticola TaxID=450363 RepID=A0ABP7XH61_9ACTN